MTLDQAIQTATAHHQEGRFQEAEALYRQILGADPNHVAALHQLGLLAHQFGHQQVAEELIRKSIARLPTAEAYTNLGAVMKAIGNAAQAEEAFRQAVRLRPNDPATYTNLGTLLWQLKRPEDSRIALEQAVALNSDFVPALHALMATLGDLGQCDRAVAAGQRAAALGLNNASFWSDMAIAYTEKGELRPAIEAFERSIALEPANGTARYNFSQVLLLSGDFERGWEEQEWRWQSANFPSPPRNFAQPMWDGTPAPGKTVLLHAEQGFGDAIMFARYIRMAAPLANIIVECQKEIAPLMRTVAGVDRLINRGDELPAFDFQLPFLSLPRVFKTRVENIPADVPYISVDPARAEKWTSRLASHRNLRVGLAWAGTVTHNNDHNRSMSLAQLAPVAGVLNVSFYSLQKGPRAGQAANSPAGMKLIDWTEELNDFADTAALISALDLVVSVDTSVVHVAGALARPVWTLLPFAPDWRWLKSAGDRTPWYPTMRLFRQDRPKDWDAVLMGIVAELNQFRRTAKDAKVQA
jgi:Flp pilus assembly protein TadD